MQGILNARLEFLNLQNVLSGASVIRRPEGYELAPGIPGGSMYERAGADL
jgi:hypothetical protein